MDKLTLLPSLGDTPADVVALLRRMEKTVSDAAPGSRLVVATHNHDHNNSSRLCDYLNRSCDLRVRVWPLSSGRCASVTGNVEHAWRSANGRTPGRAQFKVEDKKGVKVFALGASRAVL